MSEFMNAFQDTIDKVTNKSVTENGAIGYRTTGDALLDLNFCVSSFRDEEEFTELDIITAFNKAWDEDPQLAIKFLFFARDIRCGLGERRFFRTVLKNIPSMVSRDDIVRLIKLIPEFGRWDDMFIFFDTDLQDEILEIIQYQLREDIENKHNGKSISLLAKWLPSIKTSSKISMKRAKTIAKFMDMSERSYRKMISMLRGYIDVVERKMSDNKWDTINYQSVPSKANLLYSASFMKHDSDRRNQFIQSLESGEAKINSGALYPHEILQKIKLINCGRIVPGNANIENELRTLIQMWESLPNTITDPDKSTIVVCDGSQSMDQLIGKTQVTAEVIAQALAIYFAEKLHGEFKDKIITFSENPVYIDLSKCENVVDKYLQLRKYREVANTNIELVFDLILATAVRYNMKQEDVPSNIVILSDMEFDRCAVSNVSDRYTMIEPTLFDSITEKYNNAGYQLPRLVFWNIASRTCTIPMRKNKFGVCLVSGFSTNIADMVLSAETDPAKNLCTKLISERYKDVYVTSKYCSTNNVVGYIHETP